MKSQPQIEIIYSSDITSIFKNTNFLSITKLNVTILFAIPTNNSYPILYLTIEKATNRN